MSSSDYSGIDTRRGRLWGVIGVWLMILGASGAIVVLGLVAGKFLED
jgi:hypothetical protein